MTSMDIPNEHTYLKIQSWDSEIRGSIWHMYFWSGWPHSTVLCSIQLSINFVVLFFLHTYTHKNPFTYMWLYTQHLLCIRTIYIKEYKMLLPNLRCGIETLHCSNKTEKTSELWEVNILMYQYMIDLLYQWLHQVINAL